MLLLDSGTIGRSAAAMASALLLLILMPASDAAAAKAKNGQRDWSSEVLPHTADDRASEIVCQGYQKRMAKHIATIASLEQQINNSGTATPSTVVGLLRQLSGSTTESSSVKDARKRLQNERGAAAATNTLLANNNCATTNIDSAVQSRLGSSGTRKALKLTPEPVEILRSPQ